MTKINFVSAAEVLASIAKHVEVDDGRLEEWLELPPDRTRLLGREIDTYGPLGRRGFVSLFSAFVRRSRAAAELEAVLHNASESRPIRWVETSTTNVRRQAPAAGGEVQKILLAITHEYEAAVRAYRKGDLQPRSSFLPQLVTADATPLQWFGTDRDVLVSLLDEAGIAHGLRGTPKVTSRVHRAASYAPGTFDDLVENEYELARSRVVGTPKAALLANSIWPRLVEACSKPEEKPSGVHLYEGGNHLKLIGKKFDEFDKEALRKRIYRRINNELERE